LAASGVHVVHQANAGPGAARMAGVAATHAPYVLPLDADDLLAPGSLAALANELDRAPAVDVAWGDFELFTPQGGRVLARSPAARAANRRHSTTSWWQKLLLPMIERTGFLSTDNRYRLAHLVSHPLRFSRVQLQRRAAVRSSPPPRTTHTAS